MKAIFYVIHIGSFSDQSSTIEIEKQIFFEEFDECFEVYRQLVFEHIGLDIKQPRKPQPMSIEQDDDYFQIWEVALPQKEDE